LVDDCGEVRTTGGNLFNDDDDADADDDGSLTTVIALYTFHYK
jgi:hypothetical protein